MRGAAGDRSAPDVAHFSRQPRSVRACARLVGSFGVIALRGILFAVVGGVLSDFLPMVLLWTVLRSFTFERDLDWLAPATHRDLDTNGFLYWLGTRQLTQPWENPSTVQCHVTCVVHVI